MVVGLFNNIHHNNKNKIKRALFNRAELCTHRIRLGLIQTRQAKTIKSRRALAFIYFYFFAELGPLLLS